MSAIRAVSRVGSATTSALRGMDSVAMGSAARVQSAVAASVSSGMNTQGARVGSPSVQFSTVMGTQGSEGRSGGMNLDRAMGLYAEARTLECQEMLAEQKRGDGKRASDELRDRVEAALDGGGRTVRARPRRLPEHHDALPEPALQLSSAS